MEQKLDRGNSGVISGGISGSIKTDIHEEIAGVIPGENAVCITGYTLCKNSWMNLLSNGRVTSRFLKRNPRAMSSRISGGIPEGTLGLRNLRSNYGGIPKKWIQRRNNWMKSSRHFWETLSQNNWMSFLTICWRYNCSNS